MRSWSEDVWQVSVNFSRFFFRGKCKISVYPPCICSLATWELGSLDWEPAVSSAVKQGFWIILWRRGNIFWTYNWCWYIHVFNIYSFWEFRKFRYCSKMSTVVDWSSFPWPWVSKYLINIVFILNTFFIVIINSAQFVYLGSHNSSRGDKTELHFEAACWGIYGRHQHHYNV